MCRVEQTFAFIFDLSRLIKRTEIGASTKIGLLVEFVYFCRIKIIIKLYKKQALFCLVSFFCCETKRKKNRDRNYVFFIYIYIKAKVKKRDRELQINSKGGLLGAWCISKRRCVLNCKLKLSQPNKPPTGCLNGLLSLFIQNVR